MGQADCVPGARRPIGPLWTGAGCRCPSGTQSGPRAPAHRTFHTCPGRGTASLPGLGKDDRGGPAPWCPHHGGCGGRGRLQALFPRLAGVCVVSSQQERGAHREPMSGESGTRLLTAAKRPGWLEGPSPGAWGCRGASSPGGTPAPGPRSAPGKRMVSGAKLLRS